MDRFSATSALNGRKTTLLGISKRGNSYLRRLLPHGARSCLLHLHRDRDRLGARLGGLESARTDRNKVVTALANKIARIAWALMTHLGRTYSRRTAEVWADLHQFLFRVREGKSSDNETFWERRARILILAWA